METQYHHFGEYDNSPVHGEQSIPTQTGLKRIVVYILYSILVLLMLILLLVTGIKFSQMNKDITDVKLHLKSMNNEGSTSNSASKAEGLTTIKCVFLEELVPVRGTCREGWMSFQRNCYLFSTTAATCDKAEELCRSHSGHLLVLNDVEELDYISRLVESRYKYWIGLVERQHEGHWSWVDGTDFNSTPKFWDKGQPDDWDMTENGEDCGQLRGYARHQRNLWNDADCSLEYRYICETKAGETSCDNDASSEPTVGNNESNAKHLGNKVVYIPLAFMYFLPTYELKTFWALQKTNPLHLSA